MQDIGEHAWLLDRFKNEGFEVDFTPTNDYLIIVVKSPPYTISRSLPWDMNYRRSAYIFWEISRKLRNQERKWTGFGSKESLTV